jgi:hypothetical protein
LRRVSGNLGNCLSEFAVTAFQNFSTSRWRCLDAPTGVLGANARRGINQQHGLPLLASHPSRTINGNSANAATGSTQLIFHIALTARPAKVISAKYPQTADSAASALNAALAVMFESWSLVLRYALGETVGRNAKILQWLREVLLHCLHQRRGVQDCGPPTLPITKRLPPRSSTPPSTFEFELCAEVFPGEWPFVPRELSTPFNYPAWSESDQEDAAREAGDWFRACNSSFSFNSFLNDIIQIRRAARRRGVHARKNNDLRLSNHLLVACSTLNSSEVCGASRNPRVLDKGL